VPDQLQRTSRTICRTSVARRLAIMGGVAAYFVLAVIVVGSIVA
jgi:hypothetical protein